MPVSTVSDFKLGPDGDLPEFSSLVTGVDALAQRVKIRLQTHLGEWFVRPDVGLPWRQWVALKPLPPLLVQVRVHALLADTPGVDTVRDVVAVLDEDTRTMSITATVIHDLEVVELAYSATTPGRGGNVSFYVKYRRLGSSIGTVR